MRKLATYEGIIENGQGKLPSDARTSENRRVYVLLPDAKKLLTRHVADPHLVDSERAHDFQKQIIEAEPKRPGDSNLFNK